LIGRYAKSNSPFFNQINGLFLKNIMEIDMEKLQKELLAIKKMNQEWENRKKTLQNFHSNNHRNENEGLGSSKRDHKEEGAD
jgi:hypothetical protein